MNNSRDEISRVDAFLPLVFCSATLAYFLFQFVFYFTECNFYGMGLNYLLNLDTVTGLDYLKQFVVHTPFYPPLFYLFVFLAHGVLGFEYLPILGLNTLFFLGGAIYLYRAARLLTDSPVAAGAAFCIYLLYPASMIFTKVLIIEAPLLLFGPALFYHGLAADRFRHRGQAIAAGVYFALGMLTKWSFFAYAAGFGLWLIAYPFFKANQDGTGISRQQIRNLLWAMGALIVLAAPWYLFSFDPSLFSQSAKNDPTFPVYSPLANLKFNLRLFYWLAGPPLLAAAGLGWFGALALGKRRLATCGWLLVLVLLPLGLFCIPGHLEDRYLWGIFPGLALFTAVSWQKSFSRVKNSTVQWLLLAVLLGGFFYYNWGEFVRERGNMETYKVDRNYWERTVLWERADADQVLAAVDRVVNEAGRKDQPVRIAAHPFIDNMHISATHLSYHRLRRPEYADWRIIGASYYEYPDLIGLVRRGQIDFLLLDADRWRMYEAPDFDPNGDVLGNVMSRPYVDQSTGVYYEKLDFEDFRSDMEFIKRQYRLVNALELSKYTVWVMVDRRFSDEAKEASQPLHNRPSAP